MTNILFHEGYYYQKNQTKGDTTYFRCTQFKKQTCPARLIKRGDFIEFRCEHSCASTKQTESNFDICSNINEFLETQSNDLSKYPMEIYRNLLSHVQEGISRGTVMLPSKAAAYEKIRAFRRSLYSGINRIQEIPYRETVRGNPFLRRHWFGEINGKYESFVLWTSDHGLSILRIDGQIFIDATFRITPTPFMQCLIVMAHDPTTNLYVPCCWALMTSRNEYLYCSVIHEIIVLLNYKWSPKIVVVDFEKALINTVKYEFPNSKIVGCHFHFKQAILRKIKTLGLDESDAIFISDALRRLTEIDCKQINTELTLIKQESLRIGPHFEVFWKYFDSVWLLKFPPSFWNIYETKLESEFVGRTNNCLERYNRSIGEKFMNSHPNIYYFITVIKEDENHYFNMCSGIRSGSIRVPIDGCTYAYK